MKIIIDGDACPSIKLIEQVGQQYQIPVEIYCDTNHIITSDYATVNTVDDGNQSVDIYIGNIAKKNDIVVTQDYGVGVMVMGKRAKAIHPSGMIYNNDTIDQLLELRHLNQKLRKGKNHIKGPKKRTKEDDLLLKNNLVKLIEAK